MQKSFEQEILRLGRSIASIDHTKCEAVINVFYKLLGKAKPKYLYFRSIKECSDFIKQNSPDAGDYKNYFAGQQWIYWKAFYVFCEKIGVKFEQEQSKKLQLWMQESTELHWWWPFENYVIVSERPIALRLNEAGQLHSENSPAIEYADGWKLYYLNGISVPEYLIMTPSEDLDVEFFKKEKSNDVKAEFVRKFGVERLLHEFGVQIDSYKKYSAKENPWWHKSEYELWDMHKAFPGLDYQPFLKMLNQTTGIWHVEALSPSIRTIPEALKERFGGREMKIVDIA